MRIPIDFYFVFLLFLLGSFSIKICEKKMNAGIGKYSQTNILSWMKKKMPAHILTLTLGYR